LSGNLTLAKQAFLVCTTPTVANGVAKSSHAPVVSKIDAPSGIAAFPPPSF
jgi:hypothetical protein